VAINIKTFPDSWYLFMSDACCYLLTAPLLNTSKSHHFTKRNQNSMHILIIIHKIAQLYLKLRFLKKMLKGTIVHIKSISVVK